MTVDLLWDVLPCGPQLHELFGLMGRPELFNLTLTFNLRRLAKNPLISIKNGEAWLMLTKTDLFNSVESSSGVTNRSYYCSDQQLPAVRQSKVSVLADGSFFEEGVGSLHWIEGKVDPKSALTLWRLSSCYMARSTGSHGSSFQQHNHLKLKSKLLTNWFHENVPLLPWPSTIESSDLILIENL